MNEKRTALVLGATGLVGGHCIRMLLASDEYGSVIAVGRRKLHLAHSKLSQITGDMNHLESLFAGSLLATNTNTSANVDEVFCCLGTTIKKAKSKSAFKHVDYGYPLAVAKIMLEQGAKHFCVVSAVGASPTSHFFYNKIKGELERDLATLNYPFLTILRPSLLSGDRDEFRLAESLTSTVGNLFKPIISGALLEVTPVEASQVAVVMVGESERIFQGSRYQNSLVITSRQIQEYQI
jgi:uncharacterized protein YbjT (DUF2867 family)